MMPTLSPPLGSILKCHVCVSNEGKMWKQVINCCAEKSNQLSENLFQLQKLIEKTHMRAEVICRGCKMQRYCSVSHLLADRPEHQPICNVLRELQRYRKIDHPLLLDGKINDRTKLQLVISQLKLILSVKLGRPLSPREHQLIGNPAVCDVCFSSEALEDCQGCTGVAFCCADHRRLVENNHSPQDCQTLALIASPFRQLDCFVNINNFHNTSKIKETHLIDAFFEATNVRISNTPWTDLESFQLFATCSSFSGIASLCLAMTHIFWVPDPKRAVVVYVVGATEKTLNYFQDMHLQFLFLQFANIQHIQLHFIGKTLGNIGEMEKVFQVKDVQRTVIERFYPLSFSQFSCIFNVDPTLILILQPDFIGAGETIQNMVDFIKKQDVDDVDWQEDCLSSILRSVGVPICYTSISMMQAMSDFTAIDSLAKKNNISIERAYNLTENPYREILPLLNPCPVDWERIVYANNYLEVVFTSIKKY
ncbi:uncharacterized protein LOC108107354 [Drosophila eugracilis]|uniref:uncharacterized protein LOC108107354 n=1 Tax=Drosophila eugracilis TaxID=29029 RepID=UPI001BDB1711|nr:uncharacterized protein LOC108107354 [Drosophila eugracilis]